MKSVLINFLLIFALIILYALGFFDFFAKKNTLYAVFIIILLLFVLAYKLLGNPWSEK